MPTHTHHPALWHQTTTQSRNGFDKTGPYRARFILEALADLRSRLRDAGSDLILRVGRPGEREGVAAQRPRNIPLLPHRQTPPNLRSLRTL